MRSKVRVELPANLCLLAGVTREVQVSVEDPVTQRSLMDALEIAYPMLEGTIRDHTSKLRRPFIRFFACEEDCSHMPLDEPLPDTVAQGMEPFLIIGAIAGG
jgi:molybdopterin synthase sulfur carrier subunit